MAVRRSLASLASATLPGSRTRSIAVVALFVAIQIADGVLTLEGVTRFGPGAEANPVLAASILMFGLGAAVLSAKIAAVALAALLSATRAHLPLALLTLLYVMGAVVPWMLVLS